MVKICHRKGDSSIELSNLSPLLQRIYSARQVDHPQQLDCQLSALLSPVGLLNIDQSSELLYQALKQQKRIMIVGDFDADGATSTALAISCLRAFGAKYVDYVVPNRFEYGYGLTPEIIDLVLPKKPQLIITVDNGIASLAGVDHAKSHGIQVLVTDHHLAADQLPKADVIINPNQPSDSFTSKNLAGVGVIYYVMIALRRYLIEQNWFEQRQLQQPKMVQFLDLVALGTVADVVQLDHNNRILVQQGVERIRQGKTRPGILALLKLAGKNYRRMVATDLGFVVGPRLNAAGRLDDMSHGIECLLEEDTVAAMQYAEELDVLNRTRRDIEAQMQQLAFQAVDDLNLKGDLPRSLCLYHENWHQGVVGLVASKVKEKTHRPVIAFAKVNDNEIKGSARSVAGLHIRDALDEVAKQYPEVLQKFGGHAMAAGLSLQRAHLDKFRQVFDQVVSQHLTSDDLQQTLWVDGELSASELMLETAEQLRDASPWGQGFPEPLFTGCFELMDQRIVGQKHLKMMVKALGSHDFIEAIAFNVDLDRWPNHRQEQVVLVYKLDANEYLGRCKLQLLVDHLQCP